MDATAGQIGRLTAEEVNARLREETEIRLAYYASHPEQIDVRLRELDEEWDVERAIEIEAGATVLTSFVFGAVFSKKWFLLSVFAGSMLLLHNLHGGYPLLPLFRRMGFRTAREIAQERYALKAIRGDFHRVSEVHGPEQTHEAFVAASPNGHHSEARANPF
jgi:hypothetical protein